MPVKLLEHADVVQPFMLHHASIRGRLVRLSGVLERVLHHHDYPPAVQHVLGELVTLAAMLSAQLAEDAILTLQVKGDGLVRFLVVDASHGGAVRGYAHYEDEALPALHALSRDGVRVQDILGKGYLCITLDTGRDEPYQGIVPLEGESLSEAVEHYFSQSQQLEAMFHVFVEQHTLADGVQVWVSGGVMLEQMPEEGGIHAENDNEKTPADEDSAPHNSAPHNEEEALLDAALKSWDYNTLLVRTATEEELCDPHLAPSALLYRLFNENGVWVHDVQPVRAECRCSRDKLIAVLKSMDKNELEAVAEDGVLGVTCQFCNTEHVFTVADI